MMQITNANQRYISTTATSKNTNCLKKREKIPGLNWKVRLYDGLGCQLHYSLCSTNLPSFKGC